MWRLVLDRRMRSDFEFISIGILGRWRRTAQKLPRERISIISDFGIITVFYDFERKIGRFALVRI
jgi:hypothetical protein